MEGLWTGEGGRDGGREKRDGGGGAPSSGDTAATVELRNLGSAAICLTELCCTEVWCGVPIGNIPNTTASVGHAWLTRYSSTGNRHAHKK